MTDKCKLEIEGRVITSPTLEPGARAPHWVFMVEVNTGSKRRPIFETVEIHEHAYNCQAPYLEKGDLIHAEGKAAVRLAIDDHGAPHAVQCCRAFKLLKVLYYAKDFGQEQQPDNDLEMVGAETGESEAGDA